MAARKKRGSRQPVDVTERRRSEQIQRALYGISDAAHRSGTLDELYRAIHEIVSGLMSARNLYIALHDTDSDTISFPYFADEYDPTPAPKKPGRGLTEYVLRTGQPLLVTPEVSEELQRRGEVELIGAPSLDWMGVPLVADQGRIGVLAVQSYAEGTRYGERELDLLRFVSTQIAMAIERKRAVETLRDSERFLQDSQRVAMLGSYALDVPSGKWRGSRVLDEVFGIDDTHPHDVAGWVAVVHPDDRQAMADYFAREVIGKRQRFDREYRILRPNDSQERWVHGLGDLGFDAAGNVVRMVGTIQDITESKRAEEALRRSEDQYRALVDGVRDVIFALAPDGTLASLNSAFEVITGWSRDEWLGKPVVGLLHPDDVAPALALIELVLRGEPRPTAQLRIRTRRGDYRVGEFQMNLQRRGSETIGILGVVRDVTERLVLEDQLRQAQKMEAVGQLAGGIAHDFNNLLTAVTSYSELLLEDLAPADPRRADVEEIRKAGERATALTRQLLAFSRRQVLQPKLLDLNAVVLGAEKLLRRLIGEDIALVTRLDPTLGAIKADAGQLEQVIVNLAVNARDAMSGGGTLTIETANGEVDGTTPVPEPSFVAPGSYAVLRVRDTGVGMDPESLAHVFEPFFTTKETGKGTGLGLATVYGIVKQSGGFVWVDSEPGRGAAFSIYLPRVQGGGRVESGEERRAEVAGLAGSETILLVEDEEAVRAVARASLRRQGYAVLDAPDAEAALQVAAGAARPIALVVTDVVMPGMSGRALGERLSAERPGLKVLYMSGYTDDAIVQHGVLEPGLDFLQKPFTPDVLARKVREVLDRP